MDMRGETELDKDVHLAVLSAITEKLSESVMITEAEEWSSDPTILYVNPAFTRLTGYERHEAVGRTPRFLQGGKTDRRVLDRLEVELFVGRAWSGQTYSYTKSGQPFLMAWDIAPICDPGGRLRFYLTFQRRAGSMGDPGRQPARTLRDWSKR